MTTSLDDATARRRLDPSGILGRIDALPEQIEQAWAAGLSLELPWKADAIDRIVVLGMGGSGIGGSLVQAFSATTGATRPVTVVRGYRVPAYVDGRSLVLASSNSGNTEEILSALEGALAAGAKCVAMTTGGRLKEIARERNLPTFTYRHAGEPRSALGWSLAPLLAICSRAGLLPDASGDVRTAIAGMREQRQSIEAEVAETANRAKQLARRLHGKLAVFIGAEALTPVAYRWRTQVNENAKSWGIFEELPEMNHNAQTAFGLPAPALPLLHVVFLRQASMHPRVSLRVDATAQIVREAGVTAEVHEVEGEGVLAQMLRAVHFGDYVSYYLSQLNGVDASPVPGIVALKDVLASR